MPDSAAEPQPDGSGELIRAESGQLEPELPPVTPPATKAPIQFNQQVNVSIQQIPPSAWDRLNPEQIMELSKDIIRQIDIADKREFEYALEEIRSKPVARNGANMRGRHSARRNRRDFLPRNAWPRDSRLEHCSTVNHHHRCHRWEPIFRQVGNLRPALPKYQHNIRALPEVGEASAFQNRQNVTVVRQTHHGDEAKSLKRRAESHGGCGDRRAKTVRSKSQLRAELCLPRYVGDAAASDKRSD